MFKVKNNNIKNVSSIHKIYETHEKEKKRKYGQRVMNIEHGTFTPLVYGINGGMGKECDIFHKHVADKMERRTGERYEKIISYIRCKISFLVLRAALMCIRGSRSVNSRSQDVTNDFEVAVEELKLS